MKRIIILFLALMPAISSLYAASIRAIIPANYTFVINQIEDNNYISVPIMTSHIVSYDPIFGHFDTIVLTAKLKLIYYDKKSDEYHFQMSFLPDVNIGNDAKLLARLDANVSFGYEYQHIMNVYGRYNHDVDENSHPKHIGFDNHKFLLSIDKRNDIYITTQKDIMIFIETN